MCFRFSSLSFGLLLLLSAVPATAQISADDAIDLVEQMPASKLDSLLPTSSFLDWLRSIVGASAKLDWEITDCGERTGVPAVDNERDASVCVELTAVLPDRRTVGIAIGVGTEWRGLTDTPGVYNIYLEVGDNLYYFKRLRELPKALEQTRRH